MRDWVVGKHRNGGLKFVSKPLFWDMRGFYTVGGTTYIIYAPSRSGKSMVKRLLQYYHMRDGWQIISIDPEGEDDYWGALQNSQPKNLPPGTKPSPMRGEYFYCPVYGGRERKGYEIVFRPNFAKYDSTAIQSLGISESGAKYLRQIMNKYGPFKNMWDLYNFLKKIPTNSRSAKKDGFFVPSQTMNPLLRDFEGNVLSKGAWVYFEGKDVCVCGHGRGKHNMSEDRDCKKCRCVNYQKNYLHAVCKMPSGRKVGVRYDVVFEKGINAYFSFNHPAIARAEFDFILKSFKNVNKKKGLTKKVSFWIEEAQEVFVGEGGVNSRIDEFFLALGKFQGSLGLCMSSIEDLSQKVKRDNKHWFLGKVDVSTVSKFIPGGAAAAVAGLNYNRQYGYRPFVHIDKDRNGKWGTFTAFECPQEYNRRV